MILLCTQKIEATESCIDSEDFSGFPHIYSFIPEIASSSSHHYENIESLSSTAGIMGTFPRSKPRSSLSKEAVTCSWSASSPVISSSPSPFEVGYRTTLYNMVLEGITW